LTLEIREFGFEDLHESAALTQAVCRSGGFRPKVITRSGNP